MVILYSIVHLSPFVSPFRQSFPLLGLEMTCRNACAYQFRLRCRWTRDTRSQAERNSSGLHQWVHEKELTYQLPPAKPMSGCHSAYAWQCWALPEVSCTEHTHIHALNHDVWLAVLSVLVIPLSDWPLHKIVGQKVCLEPQYPRTWPFHCSIRNALEHEVKRIVGG